jgi:WD40 repeat protein
LQILEGHNSHVNGVAFSPDEKRVATSGADNRLALWEIESGRLLRVFDGHTNIAVGVGFIPRRPYAVTDPAGGKGDAPLLVSSSVDRTLRVWDMDSGVTLRVFQGHNAGASKTLVHAAQGIGQRMQVFSASGDGTVRRWDIAPLPYQQLVDLPGSSSSAAIAPSGKLLAVGLDSGALRIYSLPEMRVVGEQDHQSADADTSLPQSPGQAPMGHPQPQWASDGQRRTRFIRASLLNPRRPAAPPSGWPRANGLARHLQLGRLSTWPL